MPIYGLADDCKLGVLGKLERVTLNMLGCLWLSFAFRFYCRELQVGPSVEPVNRAGREYAGLGCGLGARVPGRVWGSGLLASVTK